MNSSRKKPDMNDSLMRSFGRVNGRKLGSYQQNLIDNLLPKISVNSDKKIQNTESIFGKEYQNYIIEIGFGKGEHLANYALANPKTGFIGCEPYINGVASLLNHIKEKEIENIRILHGDARIIFEHLPKKILKKIFILFPDPWPKVRHHKKRIINKDNLKLFSSLLKENGDIEIATDHSDYKIWIENELIQSNLFKDISISESEPDDWFKTNYQIKAEKENRKSTFYKAFI